MRKDQLLVTWEDYVAVLLRCPQYRLLFVAYCVDNAGNWLSMLACLSIIDQHGKAIYTSLYFIFRLLPNVLLSGILGPLADVLNKRNGMIVCNVGSAVSVALLAMPWPDHLQLPVIFGAALLQFSFDTLYGPLRQSLIPFLVDESDMQVVTTLDSLAWSTVGALGATAGGAICSVFGNRAAFLADAASFLIVAAMTVMLPANYEMLNSENSNFGPVVRDAARTTHAQKLMEAFRYLLSEPRVLMVCGAKACGSLVWSAADLLQVRFSEMDSMQTLGGQQLTLGILYSMVGVGCYVGPVTWNSCTPQNGKLLYSRIVSAFANFAIAYLITWLAPSILILMLATVTRAFGAGMLWSYSTLLLQIWCPVELKGRIFAFESFLFCLASIGAFFLCAALFDVWKLDERDISMLMCLLASFFLAVWLLSYVLLFVLTTKDHVVNCMEIDKIELQPAAVGSSVIREERNNSNDSSVRAGAYSTLPAAEDELNSEFSHADDNKEEAISFIGKMNHNNA